MKAYWKKYKLQFKRPAGTSRGVMQHKITYFIIIEKDGKKGMGECGLLQGLSIDDRPDYEKKLSYIVSHIHLPFEDLYTSLIEFPSIQFGLEMAFKDLASEDHILFPSDFTAGKSLQAINGLIWMGDIPFMKQQIKEKIEAGFKVLKMKISAIGIDEELAILKHLRKEYSKDILELRVDANGAFSYTETPKVLDQLATLSIHSIEQPIAKNQWQEMASLCEKTPIPIALDEELIGLFTDAQRHKMLEIINPQYLILKPSFIGGWRGSENWISKAKNKGIAYWVTSALESNVGLNAITQWNYTLNNPIPSGLGTGSLYTNNFECPLYIKHGGIGYDANVGWQIAL